MDPAFSALRADIRRTYDLLEGGRARRVASCARSPGVQAVAVYRFGQWLGRRAAIVRFILGPP